MEDGLGLKGLIPPLYQSDYYRDHIEKVPCIIKYGQSDTILVNNQVFAGEMPGVKNLNNIQIANIINYMNQKWHTDLAVVTPQLVEKQLMECSSP